MLFFTRTGKNISRGTRIVSMEKYNYPVVILIMY